MHGFLAVVFGEIIGTYMHQFSCNAHLGFGDIHITGTY